MEYDSGGGSLVVEGGDGENGSGVVGGKTAIVGKGDGGDVSGVFGSDGYYKMQGVIKDSTLVILQ